MILVASVQTRSEYNLKRMQSMSQILICLCVPTVHMVYLCVPCFLSRVFVYESTAIS